MRREPAPANAGCRTFRRVPVLAGLAVAAILLGCGGRPEPEPSGSLELGITEPNPAFLAPSEFPEFARWQPELAKIAPQHYRLVVEWSKSVGPDGTYDPTAAQGGCLRDVAPCAAWAGVRAQFEAIAAAQRAQPGRYEVMVVPLSTPAQVAAPAGGGCEKRSAEPFNRPPQDLDAYRSMIRAVRAEADRAGVAIAQWAPWNEPNHPYFISPQRTACDADAPSAAVDAYVTLARAMQEELAPGEELVLGELAATTRSGPQSTRMTEFVDALPDDLVCAAGVFSVHKYRPEDPVPALSEALDRHDCPGGAPPIWVTETGSKAHDCAAERADLERWYADPRVQAAFHYTFREDDLFPTGLVSTDLTSALPSLAEWQAWGARPDPAAAPPPSACPTG